jgi:hypothetical protein
LQIEQKTKAFFVIRDKYEKNFCFSLRIIRVERSYILLSAFFEVEIYKFLAAEIEKTAKNMHLSKLFSLVL